MLGSFSRVVGKAREYTDRARDPAAARTGVDPPFGNPL
jgi:hypothetical protein